MDDNDVLKIIKFNQMLTELLYLKF